jgi:hypothetical protein
MDTIPFLISSTIHVQGCHPTQLRVKQAPDSTVGDSKYAS